MITRAQYMSKEATYEQYYGQFVTPGVRAFVLSCIGKECIVNSTDPHFNDIALSKWDALYGGIIQLVGSAIARANGSGVSLSDTVCVAKVAARQIRKQLQL